ncbi:MAG: hypothetical protein ACRDBH_04525 [Bosea sp. (in: a-proteobacteria)]
MNEVRQTALKSNVLSIVGGILASFASIPAFAAGHEIGSGGIVLFFLAYSPVLFALGWAFGYIMRAFSNKLMFGIFLVAAASIVFSAVFGGTASVGVNRFVERSIALIAYAAPFAFGMILSWTRMGQSAGATTVQGMK